VVYFYFFCGQIRATVTFICVVLGGKEGHRAEG